MACGCDDNFHDTTIELEKDRGNIYLHFYVTRDVVDAWEDLNWLSRLKLRMSKAYRILVHGCFKHEFCVILKGEGHIRDFVSALQLGLDKLQEGN